MITKKISTRGRKKKEPVVEAIVDVNTGDPSCQEAVVPSDKPIELNDWVPTEKEMYFTVDENNNACANYFASILKMNHTQFETFIIIKKHYIERMSDILHHINYFINFYDVNREYCMSLLSVKYLVDTRQSTMTQKAFKQLILERIVTPTYVANIKKMVHDLYKVNIDTDVNGDYRSTPKITNAHAKVILAVSFAIRTVLPICIHFTNISSSITTKRDYIPFFDSIFMDIISAFEKDDVEIYSTICRFIAYRISRKYNSDIPMWEKKKQVHGANYETYLDELIHEVILVKSLYKIKYDSSVVSYFDGIIQKNYLQFKSENYKAKPVEISSEDFQNDSDDFLTHSESLEMSMYRIDESNIIINEVNNEAVMRQIHEHFNIDITDEEYDFYMENIRLNRLTQVLIHAFYSRFFRDTKAVQLLPKSDVIYLIIVLKKYLQLSGMVILPQILTATVLGKFKENIIKNYKFIEKYKTSTVYQNVIEDKFKYVMELNSKEDPIIKWLSIIINSVFVFVDPDPEINGKRCEDIQNDLIIDEFLRFLSII